MKLEGIPTKLEHCHHHEVNVNLDIQLGARTTQNIVAIIKTAGTVAVTTYAVKKTIDLIQRGGFEILMKGVWK